MTAAGLQIYQGPWKDQEQSALIEITKDTEGRELSMTMEINIPSMSYKLNKQQTKKHQTHDLHILELSSFSCTHLNKKLRHVDRARERAGSVVHFEAESPFHYIQRCSSSESQIYKGRHASILTSNHLHACLPSHSIQDHSFY